MGTKGRTLPAIALVASGVLALSAYATLPDVSSGTPPRGGGQSLSIGSSPTAPSAESATGTAVSVLAELPVKGRAPKTGYARRQFGAAWTDNTTALWGHDGLSTRENILSRDLTGISCKVGKSRSIAPPCIVVRGTLTDPYTGSVVQFVRGQETSPLVPIDHVVSLGDAWQKGAQLLSFPRRVALANDPLNLVATTRSPNSAKNDSDAATWLIPRKGGRCRYVARQVAVKKRYHLWITQAEKDAIARVLSACPTQPLPDDGDAVQRTM